MTHRHLIGVSPYLLTNNTKSIFWPLQCLADKLVFIKINESGGYRFRAVYTEQDEFSLCFLLILLKTKKRLSALVCGVYSIRTLSLWYYQSFFSRNILRDFLRGTESTTGYFVSAFNERVIHPEGLLQWSGHLQSSSVQWKDAISSIRIQWFLCFTCIYRGLKVKMSQPMLTMHTRNTKEDFKVRLRWSHVK